MQDKAITELIVNVLHLAIKHMSDKSEFIPSLESQITLLMFNHMWNIDVIYSILHLSLFFFWTQQFETYRLNVFAYRIWIKCLAFNPLRNKGKLMGILWPPHAMREYIQRTPF